MPEPTGLRATISKSDAFAEFRYVPATGRLEPTRSGLGSFLYSMHYLGPLPAGIWLAGLASMALLLTLLSGLFIHLKDLSRQWFQFRPERARRTWASDLHKVLGVFGLPYQLLYAWTGAVLSLGYLVVEPAFSQVVFSGNEQPLALAKGEPAPAVVAATGKRVPELPDIDALVRLAERRVPGASPSWIGLEHVQDEASTLSLYGDIDGAAFAEADVTLRVRDGAVLSAHAPGEATSLARFDAWFHGLHYARFGGYPIKLLYALLALGTCAVLATGNLVGLERRDAARAHVGHRILERLTAGCCAGLVLATSAAFLANRLLPALLPQRAAAEQAAFWCSGTLALLLPLLWPAPRRAGALWWLVVLLDVSTRASLHSPIQRGVLVGLALLGGACLLGGARLLRPRGARGAQPLAALTRTEVKRVAGGIGREPG